jgi:hypothetical protein
MTPALSIVQNEPAPPAPADTLATFLAERDALASEYSSLAAQRDALARFEGEENAALAEIGEIGGREVEAIKVWAANPVGDPPQAEHKAREKAALRLARAQANIAAAKVARGELEDKMREVHARQLAVEELLAEEIAGRLAAEYAELHASVAAKLAEIRSDAARLGGLQEMWVGEGQHFRQTDQIDKATVAFRRAELLAGVDLRTCAPTGNECLAEADYWRARVEALRNGDAA